MVEQVTREKAYEILETAISYNDCYIGDFDSVLNYKKEIRSMTDEELSQELYVVTSSDYEFEIIK